MNKLKTFVFLFISFQLSAQTIPFQLLPSGHILLKTTVEGKEGNFIFDTGGGINLFFNDFAQDLSQKSTYNFIAAFRATGERLDIPVFKASQTTFAGKTFPNVPYSTFDMKLNGVNGLISLQMFKEQDFILDYDKKEITLTNFDDKKHPKFLELQFSTLTDNVLDIFTTVTLNNEYKILVLLDSGAGKDSFWLSDKFIPLLNLDKDKLESLKKTSEFNENYTTTFYKGSIDAISTPYSTIKEAKVTFVDGLIYEGKTSINWLGNKLGFSVKNKKIYILD